MSKLSSLKQNSIAIGVICILIIFVYGTTTAINAVMLIDPDVCNETYFEVTQVCWDDSRTALTSFQETVNLKVINDKNQLSGFTVRVFGTKNSVPQVIFRTVASGEEALLKVQYDRELVGDIRSIEIEPMLLIDRQVQYCSLRHGIIYDGDIQKCS